MMDLHAPSDRPLARCRLPGFDAQLFQSSVTAEKHLQPTASNFFGMLMYGGDRQSQAEPANPPASSSAVASDHRSSAPREGQLETPARQLLTDPVRAKPTAGFKTQTKAANRERAAVPGGVPAVMSAARATGGKAATSEPSQSSSTKAVFSESTAREPTTPRARKKRVLGEDYEVTPAKWPRTRTPPVPSCVSGNGDEAKPLPEGHDIDEVPHGPMMPADADTATTSTVVQLGNKLKRYPQQGSSSMSHTREAQPEVPPTVEHHSEAASPKAMSRRARKASGTQFLPLEAPRSTSSEVGRRDLAYTEVPLSALQDSEVQSSNGPVGVRLRPRRTRIRPLEFWRNERVIFKRQPGEFGYSVAGVLKNSAPHCITDPQKYPEMYSRVQDPVVETFQGCQGSKGIISNSLRGSVLSTHVVKLPPWRKHQKYPPTVVLPFRPHGNSLFVLEGMVRLAAEGADDRYKEIQLRKGDIMSIPCDKQTRWLVAPMPVSGGGNDGALLKLICR